MNARELSKCRCAAQENGKRNMLLAVPAGGDVSACPRKRAHACSVFPRGTVPLQVSQRRVLPCDRLDGSLQEHVCPCASVAELPGHLRALAHVQIRKFLRVTMFAW